MDSITGKWIGEYIYGEGYVRELSGKSVKFHIDIYFDGDVIRGTCNDEETEQLFQKPATIEGTFENDTILFYKTYPVDEIADGKDKLKAQEYTSSSVQYTGVLKKKLFFKTFYFEGTWDINGSFLDDKGVSQYYSLNGTWSMQKVK